MNNYFDLLSKDIKNLWSGLDLLQKLAIIGLIIATVAAIVYFIAKSTEPNWGVLYSDLAETDAVAVIENLKSAGYPYKLSDDRQTILVPAELKEDLRLMIAENDIIHDSTPGFELLDKLQIGATDFQNKLTKQRIFQGELTRTIERINGIRKARIQLANPERSIFADKDELPSASVMLILEPGKRIKQEQVKAIKNIVAYGVPRLTPERVFISDQNGQPLSDEVSSHSSDINDYRIRYEKHISKKVTKVLERLVGHNNVSVEVTASMNFDSAKATIEKYLPAGNSNAGAEGVLISTQSESEAFDNNQSQGEVAQDNTNENRTEEQNQNRKNYQKNKVIKNFNVSKEIKQVVYAPGTLERLTIAVALNKILTSKEKEEIKKLVTSASGANEKRGDLVTVTGIQFAVDKSAKDANVVLKQMQTASIIEMVVRNVGPLIVVLILGLTALMVLNSLFKKPLVGEQVYEGGGDYYPPADYGRADMEAAGSPGDAATPDPEMIEMPQIPVIEAKLEPELERMKVDLNNIISTDPSDAARLLLSYVKE